MALTLPHPRSPPLTPVTLSISATHDMRARSLDSMTSVDPDQIVPPSGALFPLLKTRRTHANTHLVGIFSQANVTASYRTSKHLPPALSILYCRDHPHPRVVAIAPSLHRGEARILRARWWHSLPLILSRHSRFPEIRGALEKVSIVAALIIVQRSTRTAHTLKHVR